LKAACGESFLKKVLQSSNLNSIKTLLLCWNCNKFICKNEMPRICAANGLDLDEIPSALQLKELEQQTIAKTLLFMKIKKLPTSRMNAVYDRVINVPLNDHDVTSTVTNLPRMPEDAKVVAVQLKRKLEYKSVEASQYLRPNFLRNALKFLKEIGNKHYQDITIDEKVLEALEHKKDIDPEEESGENEDVEANLNLREQSTCLIPVNPESDVVINEKDHIDENSAIKIAPGEGML
jgi:hypothetical protein